jgi:G3E family GTPase
VLRVKGILNIAGIDGPVAVHGIHHVVHPPVVLDSWSGAAPRSRLVLIVQNDIADHVRQTWSSDLGKAA